MPSSFDKEFMMEMFLDSDSVSSTNKLAVALANVVNENNDNLIMMQDMFSKQLIHTITNNTHTEINEISDETYLKIMAKYCDNFEETFKMGESTFQTLIKYLNENVIPNKTASQLENKLCIFLLLLVSDVGLEDLVQMFNIQKTPVISALVEISKIIMEQRYSLINWPSKEDQHLTRLKIYTQTKFPNCVGFLDAISFKTGIRQEENLNEILLQAVCNEYYMFLDVFVGDIGNNTKLYVYQESPISAELNNTVDQENHILGTADYELDMNLITPYIEEGLTEEKSKFNLVHNKTMVYINRAFDILKQRFCNLNHCIEDLLSNVEDIRALLYAVCVLHNFIIFHEGCPSFKEETLCDDPIVIDTSMIVITASGKRQFLTSYINCTSLI